MANPNAEGTVRSDSFACLTRPFVDPAALTADTPLSADVAPDADNSYGREVTPNDRSDSEEEPPQLCRRYLKKIHLQLKHGTLTAVRDYVRSAGL